VDPVDAQRLAAAEIRQLDEECGAGYVGAAFRSGVASGSPAARSGAFGRVCETPKAPKLRQPAQLAACAGRVKSPVLCQLS